MCTVCGCGEGEVQVEGGQSHDHSHPHDHHHHQHTEHSHQQSGDDLHFGKGAAHAHVAGLSQSRMVQIEQDILGKNDRYAAQNRSRFRNDNLFAINLVSSPGSGKTQLLTETVSQLNSQRKVAVIEGDQQTSNDAERIRQTGVQAVQVNTGKGCHLDAHMVGHAMERFTELQGGYLFIENVGNLVCPAAFDLGEAHKVAILSVTEGEDKPLKYPDMFFAADLMILNKTDLLPYLDFDVERCIEYTRQINPKIEILQLSAKTGEGMAAWIGWLESHRSEQLQHRIDHLQSEIDQIQALL